MSSTQLSFAGGRAALEFLVTRGKYSPWYYGLYHPRVHDQCIVVVTWTSANISLRLSCLVVGVVDGVSVVTGRRNCLASWA
jgi:hypothetical protein